MIYLFYLLLFVVAFLYASVGHGGASGYITLMILFAFPKEQIKIDALILNLFVSGVAFYNFYDKITFNKKLSFFLFMGSIPFAFIGGMINIDTKIYKIILGIFLVFSVLRLLQIFPQRDKKIIEIKILYCIIIGSILGFFSGLIGIGGGILLSPILILLGWATIKESATISALFIFLNSIAGLFGNFINKPIINNYILIYILIVFVGGLLGAYWGSKISGIKTLKKILAFVLLLACYKLFFT